MAQRKPAQYARNQKYNDSPKKHFGSLKEMVDKYYLRSEQHTELKQYCDRVKITFISTPFANEEVDLLDKLDVPFFKIASMDVNNLSLLKHAAGKNKPIVLSTGMATLAEIENAVKTIEAEGNKQIILLHCVAIYPPVYEEINLNNIFMLRQVFGHPIGFSDHTIGTSIPLASIALGACVIEKHFTIDKDLPGWDHEISADPDEMKVIVEESRNIAMALGQYRRIVGPEEETKKAKFRRSIVTKTDLKKGEILREENILFKRPGTGICPDALSHVVGRELKRNISSDEIIRWDDFV